MKRITIKDIARLVGVNVSTVSRALKDHPSIGATMKEKIRTVADELGYFPNHQAINFRQSRSKLIGLILPELGRFFFPDLIKAIEEIAKKKGYTFITFQSNDLLEKEKECLAWCRNFGVDGLLACLTKETTSIEHFAKLMQNNIPVVFIDKILRDSKNASVSIDDFQAAYIAVRYLIKKNYQRIAGIFANENLVITQQRKAGYQAALKEYQLPYQKELCYIANDIAAAEAHFKDLLLQVPRPDAVFTISDELLSTIIPLIYKANLIIPQDLAVISISNGYLPYYIKPNITHIKHSGYQVGQAAVNLLIDLIEHPDPVNNQQIELETYLVELDSC